MPVLPLIHDVDPARSSGCGSWREPSGPRDVDVDLKGRCHFTAIQFHEHFVPIDGDVFRYHREDLLSEDSDQIWLAGHNAPLVRE